MHINSIYYSNNNAMYMAGQGGALPPPTLLGGPQTTNWRYIFEWGGGVPHSHSEARGARDIGYFQINVFQSQLGFFLVVKSTFLENPPSE